MTTHAILRIRFTGFWVAGTGASRGRHVDVVAHRDRDELPAMPMSQVKGQLRETGARLAAGRSAGWTSERLETLFGTRTRPRTNQMGSEDTNAGSLAFRGEARLPDAIRAALRENPDGERLFRRLAATRIDENGVAQDKTLRAIEAVVPLTLEGAVVWIGTAPPPKDWVHWLDEICAATLAFGKLKTDGYGRAIAECVA